MGGQFPCFATIEPEIEGTWHKFMNNDRLEIGKGHESFRNKALAFTHWTFNRFGGKLLVCDLQGKLKFLDSQHANLEHILTRGSQLREQLNNSSTLSKSAKQRNGMRFKLQLLLWI